MSGVELPTLAADLTFVKVNRGRVYSGLADWDVEDRQPDVGEHVMVADGGSGPYEAVIDEIEPDGTIVLTVLDFGEARAAS